MAQFIHAQVKREHQENAILSFLDFSLTSQQIFFVILPAAALTLGTLYYACRLLGKPRVVKSGYLFWFKLSFGFALCISQILEVTTSGTLPSLRDAVGFGAGAASCLASVCVLLSLVIEHFYSYSPSTILSIYLACTIVFDIVRVRLFFLRGLSTEGILGAISIGCKVVLMVLEEVPKRSLFFNEEKRENMSKVRVSGFWARTFFTWLYSIFLLGYRATLRPQDLEKLDVSLVADTVVPEFRKNWIARDPDSRRALFWAYVKTCGTSHLLPGIIASLLLVATSYAQPFMIKNVLNALSSQERHTVSTIVSVAAATALTYFAHGIVRAVQLQAMARCAVILRTTFIQAVYDHLLDLDADDMGEQSSFSLVSTDIPRMENITRRILDCFTGVLSIIAGTVYFSLGLGKGAILPIAPLILICLACYFVSKRIKVNLHGWNRAIDNRFTTTRKMILNIKSVRMAGLVDVFVRKINDKFAVEIEASQKYRLFYSILFGFELTTCAMTPILVLAAIFFYSAMKVDMPLADIYAHLAVSTLIVQPMGHIVHGFSYLPSMFACHDRVEAFLKQPVSFDERKDARVLQSVDGSISTVRTSENTSADIQHVYTCPASDGHQALQDVHAYFPERQVSMIIGPMGSGKSALLRLLIGEMETTQGKIFINPDRVAYCAQTAWVQSQAVRSCIIGPNSIYNVEWYNAVTRACCLDVDFASWPEGDRTIAGNSASNLSGGQKQRIALARAIYSQKPILVLDDLFSGLDRETAQTIFENLLGVGGLLRTAQSTVIMATSLVEYVHYADVVMQFDDQGGLTTTQNETPTGVGGPSASTSTACQSPRTEGFQSPSIKGDEEKKIRYFGQRTIKPSPYNSPPGSKAGYQTQRTKNRARSPRAVKGRKAYQFYFLSFGVRAMIGWILWIFLGELFFKASNIYLRFWLPNRGEYHRYFYGNVAIASVAILFSSLSVWVFFVFLVANSYGKLHDQLLVTTTKASTHYLSTTNAGDLLNRFGQDLALTSQELPFAVWYSLVFFFAALIGLCIIAVGAPYAALIIPVFFIFLCFLQRFYLRTSRQLRLLQIESMAPVYALLNETTSGILHIRAFKWQSWYREEHMDCLDRAHGAMYLMYSVQQWLFFVLDISVCVLSTFVVALALFLNDPTSSSPAVGLALISMIELSKEISLFLRYWAEVETCMGAVARIIDFEHSTPKEPGPVKGSKPADDNWPQFGAIKVKNMKARFDTSERDSAPVLSGVDFEVKPGQKVGIVGRTGSGKSSLLMTMVQMLRYDGTMQIDGIELRSVHPDIIRSRITIVPQDAVLLPGSVRDNLHPVVVNVEAKSGDAKQSKQQVPSNGSAAQQSETVIQNSEAASITSSQSEVTDEMLTEILQKVQLWPYIERHGGLDTDVETLSLSDGQQQLLTLGRAMIHHIHTQSSVTLMDEVTSQLDHDTDDSIQLAIKDVFGDCTLMVVAHREHTLQDSDFILSVADGMVTKTYPIDEGSAGLSLTDAWLLGDVSLAGQPNRVVFEPVMPSRTPEQDAISKLRTALHNYDQSNGTQTPFGFRNPGHVSPTESTGTIRLYTPQITEPDVELESEKNKQRRTALDALEGKSPSPGHIAAQAQSQYQQQRLKELAKQDEELIAKQREKQRKKEAKLERERKAILKLQQKEKKKQERKAQRAAAKAAEASKTEGTILKDVDIEADVRVLQPQQDNFVPQLQQDHSYDSRPDIRVIEDAAVQPVQASCAEVTWDITGKGMEVNWPSSQEYPTAPPPDIKGKGKAVEFPPPMLSSSFEVKTDVKGKAKAVEMREPLSFGLPPGFEPAKSVFSQSFPLETGTFAEHAYAVALEVPESQERALHQATQGNEEGQPGPSSALDPMPEPSPRLESLPGPSSAPESIPNPPSTPGPSSTADPTPEASSAPDQSQEQSSGQSSTLQEAPVPGTTPGPSSESGSDPSPSPNSGPSELEIRKQELRDIQAARTRAREEANPREEPRIPDEDLPLLQPVAYEGPWSPERPRIPAKKKKVTKKKTVPVTAFLPDLDQLKR